MDIRKNINPADYEVGVLIGRFQTPYLHEGHLGLIQQVVDNHKKVIILLGIPRVHNTKANPLDFATRRLMIQTAFPNVIIMPIQDQRKDEIWSKNVDSIISLAYVDKKTIIYGSRDSFIPHYHGKNPVIELEPIQLHNSTELRSEVAKESLNTTDFRKGVIYSTFNQRPITYSTVDVVAYNEKGEILLGKKPNEDLYRFIGGFVDRTDTSICTVNKTTNKTI